MCDFSAASGRVPAARALPAALVLLAAAWPAALSAQTCPTGCVLTPGTTADLTGTYPNWQVQKVSGVYTSLPASCAQGEFANVVNTSLPQIDPFWCATTNNWLQFPLLDAAANGNLSVPGNLNVGASSSTGVVKFDSAGGGNESLTVSATLGPAQIGTITIPPGTANMLTDSLQATVTNKNLQDSSAAGGVVFANASDSTTQLGVNLSGAASGATATLALVEQSPITITGPTVSSTLGGVVYASTSTTDTVVDSNSGIVHVAFAQRYTIPAGVLTQNKIFRITAFFGLSTSSGPPGLSLTLQFAGTNVSSMPVTVPPANLSSANPGQGSAVWLIQGTAAAGSPVAVQFGSQINLPGIPSSVAYNNTTQPFSGLSTGAAAAVHIVASWLIGTDSGGSSITLQQIFIEVLN